MLSTLALVISAGIAGYGVYETYGIGIAGVVYFIITTVVEVGAAMLPKYAANKRGVARMAVLFMFLGASVSNMASGHLGMRAIDDLAISATRAPLLDKLKDAQTAFSISAEALTEYDRKQSAAMSGKAGRKAAKAALKDTARDALVCDKVAAERVVKDAEEALSRAPRGRHEWELWAIAAILELFKGCFMWASKPSVAVRKARGKPLDEMSFEELDAAEREARSLAATIQRLKPKVLTREHEKVSKVVHFPLLRKAA